MSQTKPLKKEFTTVWMPDLIFTDSENASEFFDKAYGRSSKSNVIVPVEIKYSDLLGFIGKKTKVTIEVVE